MAGWKSGIANTLITGGRSMAIGMAAGPGELFEETCINQ